VLVVIGVSREGEGWREAGREDEGRRKASATWSTRRESSGQHRRRRWRCGMGFAEGGGNREEGGRMKGRML